MSREIIMLDSALPLVFDGNRAQCFVVKMRNTVTKARVKNVAPGVIYTFMFNQDGSGNHRFAWPQQCLNATAVNPSPFALTVVHFIGDANGNLDANMAATW